MSLSAASLRSLISLVEKRDRLTAELGTVEKDITQILGNTSVKKGSHVTGNGRSAQPRGKRGQVKGQILEELKAAGESGITVKDLSAKLGIKNANLHVWLATTGKKIKEIKKVGKGLYKYSAKPTVRRIA